MGMKIVSSGFVVLTMLLCSFGGLLEGVKSWFQGRKRHLVLQGHA
eukprot:CAMPEP_0172776392 /NCGR_PEP_ID=MMETSP1074-20121228/199776_1 /TAXON_ID=2916 /ORGANISM="Ceratium fusus, Strain PA161109" /LENGTH=44 /DNA_ID= /DNA_START= /DNA_END= /DNA_ORIENTATION=